MHFAHSPAIGNLVEQMCALASSALGIQAPRVEIMCCALFNSNYLSSGPTVGFKKKPSAYRASVCCALALGACAGASCYCIRAQSEWRRGPKVATCMEEDAIQYNSAALVLHVVGVMWNICYLNEYQPKHYYNNTNMFISSIKPTCSTGPTWSGVMYVMKGSVVVLFCLMIFCTKEMNRNAPKDPHPLPYSGGDDTRESLRESCSPKVFRLRRWWLWWCRELIDDYWACACRP